MTRELCLLACVRRAAKLWRTVAAPRALSPSSSSWAPFIVGGCYNTWSQTPAITVRLSLGG